MSVPGWRASPPPPPPPPPPERADGRPEAELGIDDVEGVLENGPVRPMLDLNADEALLMWKLRKSLHADDFRKIFNEKDRRIGDVL